MITPGTSPRWTTIRQQPASSNLKKVPHSSPGRSKLLAACSCTAVGACRARSGLAAWIANVPDPVTRTTSLNSSPMRGLPPIAHTSPFSEVPRSAPSGEMRGDTSQASLVGDVVAVGGGDPRNLWGALNRIRAAQREIARGVTTTMNEPRDLILSRDRHDRPGRRAGARCLCRVVLESSEPPESREHATKPRDDLSAAAAMTQRRVRFMEGSLIRDTLSGPGRIGCVRDSSTTDARTNTRYDRDTMMVPDDPTTKGQRCRNGCGRWT